MPKVLHTSLAAACVRTQRVWPCALLQGRALQGDLARPHSHTPPALFSDDIGAIQVATVTRSKAHRITVAAHTNNLAVVTTTWKQMAKTYCIKLQKFGLTSSIAPGDGGGDDGGSDGPETQ